MTEKPLTPAARSAALLIALMTVVLAVWNAMPWQPTLPRNGIDPSGVAVLEWALLGQKFADNPLIFTYGPLVFLHARSFHPELWPWLIAYWGAIGLLLGLFLATFVAQVRPWVSIGLLVVLGLLAGMQPDAWQLLIPLTAALAAVEPPGSLRRYLTWPLVLLAVIGGLAKFTFWLAAVPLLLVADGVRLLRDRQRPLLTLVYLLLSWGLYWWLTGSGDWPGFVVGSLAVSAGYSDAMQQYGAWWEVVAAGGVSLLLMLTVLLTPANDRGWRDWFTRGAVATLFGVVILLMIKAGMVRPDRHVQATTAGLLMLAIILVWRTFSLTSARQAQMLALCGLLMAAGFSGVWHWRRPNTNLASQGYFEVRRPWAALSGYPSIFTAAGREELAARWEARLEGIRQCSPVAGISGSVDIYSFNQHTLLAHGLEYRPRPVLQSYSAYTPWLAERNVQHLLGPRAAETILFRIEPIDDRLPALEDGASWPVLWSRYDVQDGALESGHLLLERRAGAARELVWGSPTAVDVVWDQWLPLGESANGAACLWLTADIDKNVLGRLLSTLFKAPVIRIKLRLSDGSEITHRLVPGMAAAGFLVSPYVTETEQFADRCSAPPRSLAPPVSAIAFYTAPVLRLFYQQPIHLTLKTLEVRAPADGKATVSQ